MWRACAAMCSSRSFSGVVAACLWRRPRHADLMRAMCARTARRLHRPAERRARLVIAGSRVLTAPTAGHLAGGFHVAVFVQHPCRWSSRQAFMLRRLYSTPSGGAHGCHSCCGVCTAPLQAELTAANMLRCLYSTPAGGAHGCHSCSGVCTAPLQVELTAAIHVAAFVQRPCRRSSRLPFTHPPALLHAWHAPVPIPLLAMDGIAPAAGPAAGPAPPMLLVRCQRGDAALRPRLQARARHRPS
jgi:hypothetical protein